jgi:hypothetical protein
VNGVQNTYLYAPAGQGDSGGATTASQSVAAASPYTIRNRPAWLFHANNRVINPGADASHNNVDFWLKLGYIGKDSTLASRWADNASLYFTLDGSTPAGSLGHPTNTTQVASLAFDHIDEDYSIAGNAMWWVCTVSNLPIYTTINYKIGAWNSGNTEEKFADYNASTNNQVFSFSIGTLGDPVLTVNHHPPLCR